MTDQLARWISLITFLCTYTLFVVRPNIRTWAAVGGALIVVVTGALSHYDAFWAINWNVMGIFWGMLVISELFMRSRMPAFLAEWLVQHSPTSRVAIISLFCLSSGISVFLENVAVVLLLAPIAFEITRRLEISPIPVLIGIAVCSNLQGCATLIGDPPSMLLGDHANMTFLDFFIFDGKPSIFFAVQLAAVAGMAVLFFLLDRGRPIGKYEPAVKVTSMFPTWLLAGMVLALAASSFVEIDFHGVPGAICMAAAGVGLVWYALVTDEKTSGLLRDLDWETTGFLVCIFILVGSLATNDWLVTLADFLVGVIGDNVVVCYILLVGISVAISAFVDNVPFLVAMLPVTETLAKSLDIEPTILYFGLLLGASVGGNITPVGASANIVAAGQLRQQNYPVTFLGYVKIGLPFTLVATTVAASFAWFFFAP